MGDFFPIRPILPVPKVMESTRPAIYYRHMHLHRCRHQAGRPGVGRRHAVGVHTCDPDRHRHHAAVAIMFMTYMSLGVVVDVTTIMIIDMIRPMIRIPPHHLFCNIDLGNSSLYENLATNHSFFSKTAGEARTHSLRGRCFVGCVRWHGVC